VDASGENAARASAQSRPSVYNGPQVESETRSRKRRKLSSEQDNAQLITPATSQASGATLFGRRSTSGRKSSGPPIQIAEVPEQIQLESGGAIAGTSLGSSLEEDKENGAPGAQVKKTPRSIVSTRTPRRVTSSARGRQNRSSRSSSQQSETMSILSATGDVGSEDEVLIAVLDESEDDSLDDHEEGVSLLTAQGELPDTTMELVAVLDETTFNRDEIEYTNVIDPSLLAEGQTETPAPRSANIKKKRSSLKAPGQRSAGRRVSRDTSQLSSDNSAQQAEPELITPHQAQPTPRGHPPSDDSFYQANHDDEDATYLEPTSPVVPTPKTVAKKPRKPKVTKTRRISTSSSTQTKRRKAKPHTFPVLTHRLTNTSALPTITEEPEPDTENSDTEPNSRKSSTKFHDRPTPNAVDVLAQFCREDIEAAIENATENATTTEAGSSSRAELKRKRTALQTFSTGLETRLFDLSTAVDHRLETENRVKKSAQEKDRMYNRWMELRRERETVAKKIDEAKRRKDERQKDDGEIRRLSELLWRTELEVQKGVDGEREGEGLEWKLKTVAEGVSARVGGGLLDRVRGFNAVLDRLVGVLDRRRGI
jgi:hypothetical protein